MPATSSIVLIFLPHLDSNASSSLLASQSVANGNTTSSPSLSSPASTLITHISRTHHPVPLGGYSLDHRLLVDTLSLLPGHKATRKHTHFLTLATHYPGKTFVGTGVQIPNPSASKKENSDDNTAHPSQNSGSAVEENPAGDFTLITIPSQPDSLFSLVTQRMAPLWAPLQGHRVEKGVSFMIGDWSVRIGELRTLPRGQAPAKIKGCLCEVGWPGDVVGDDNDNDNKAHLDASDHEEMAKAFFEALVQDSGIDVGQMKVSGPAFEKENQLARLYMDVLAFSKTA